MQRVQIIASMIFMALTGGSSSLLAQCGSDAGGTVVVCCGRDIFVSNEFKPGGGSDHAEPVTCNAAGVHGCPTIIVFATGGCPTSASLLTPEVRRKLDQASQYMPLLVASCTGGFMPYQPHHAEAPEDKEWILRSPTPHLSGHGE